MIHDLHHRAHGAGFGIIGAVNQALDASMYHCARAHRARFNCNKQNAVSQAMVTNGCTGLAKGDDLGVGRGVVIGDVAVPSTADDFAVADDYCANRNFSNLQRSLSATERFFHPEFVGRISIRCCPLLMDVVRHGR